MRSGRGCEVAVFAAVALIITAFAGLMGCIMCQSLYDGFSCVAFGVDGFACTMHRVNRMRI